MPKYTKHKFKPPIKVHGGKSHICRWIIEQFPDHYEELTYCEPFCASASVFFNKEASKEEVVSDLDPGIIAILKALRDESKELITRLKRTHCTERTFKMAQNRDKKGFEDYIDHAVNEFILRQMSRGGVKKTFAWPDHKSCDDIWEAILEPLHILSIRLQNCAVLCADFKNVLPIWDEENTLLYLDPPPLRSTKPEAVTLDKELTVEDHIHLLHLAKNARGKIIISGYPSPLYNRTLKNWRCKKKNVVNHSSQAKTKERRIECLWMNY